MTKQGMGHMLDGLLRSFDQEVNVEDLRAAVEDGYHRLACEGNLPQEVRQDLRLLENLMVSLGWQTYGSPAKLENRQPSATDFGDLDIEHCFVRGILRPGCGRYLDLISSIGPQADALMERLLRHVEVKRQKALRKFAPDLSAEAQWLERCDVSILFSHYARRRKDLRFLNAALKMNEWYLKESQRGTDAVQARLLLALAEQELSAGELLAC